MTPQRLINTLKEEGRNYSVRFLRASSSFPRCTVFFEYYELNSNKYLKFYTILLFYLILSEPKRVQGDAVLLLEGVLVQLSSTAINRLFK